MTTKADLAKVVLVAQAQPVAAALGKMLEIDDEAGGVLPTELRNKLEIAHADLEWIESYLFDELMEAEDGETEEE